MTTDSCRVGQYGVVAGDRALVLCDARGIFPEPVEDVLPGTGDRGDWRLHVHCFLLQVAGKVVLVDAGAGPPGAPAAGWFDDAGHLVDDLADVGLTPSDVTHVVLTHLHVDHVGWTVRGEPLTPTFPNARHIVQEAELAHLGQRPPYERHVKPLRDAGLLQPVDGAVRVLPRVDLVPTPGHTPGHQSVVADLVDRTLVIAGDAFVHPAQLREPYLAYRYESDERAATETRRRLLRRASQPGVVLAPAHFPSTMLTLEGTGLGASRIEVLALCRHAEAVVPLSTAR
jgi:glyoxylase-like metal-dependent hydrolase (beta-lactamase superfamily II)